MNHRYQLPLLAFLLTLASVWAASIPVQAQGHPGGAPPVAAATPPTAAELQAAAVAALDTPRARIEATVRYLASPELTGRRTGTAGADMAAEFIAALLAEYGYAPAPGSRGFEHGFAVTSGLKVIGEPSLSIAGHELARGTDYNVASFSGSGSTEAAPLVFAGYGIVAPELGWNDYAGIDPEGAVVVVVRGEPYEQWNDETFAATTPSVYADIRRKASTARDMGAAGMVILTNPLTRNTDTLPEERPTFSAANFDIPVVMLTRGALDAVLPPEPEFDLFAELVMADYYREPRPQVLADAPVDMAVTVEKQLATGFNVVGWLPGNDSALAEEYVIVGGHYDHLGIGGPESMHPSRYGEVHPGADDNASGTAVVLEIARWAATSRAELDRSLLVCLFSGEEMGLLGSAALMRNPPVPVERMHSMLNFDMVGHLKDNTLIMGGAHSADELPGLVAAQAAAVGLSIDDDESGLGGSDHLSFIREGVPAAFFNSGPYGTYHTPDDSPDDVNYSGLESIATMGQLAALELATRPDALSFNPDAVVIPSQGRNRGDLKVTMGTVPHYAGEQPVAGMGVGDVVPDGPAEQGGILGGDIIVKIKDSKIGNIYDFMFVLQDCQPGDVVPVVVWRDGSELEFMVTLAARNIER